MNPAEVSIGLALIAGLASFLSPCVLALVPAYITYLGSRSITDAGVEARSRGATIAHGVAFVAGFSMVFVTLGAAAGALGGALFDARGLITRIGGIVVILFGLHTVGVIHIPFLEYDLRRHRKPDPRLGYLSSALMGVFFSAGWAPCVGPVLGAILTLALTTNAVGQGVVLLAAYSLGLGIPFVAAAAGVGGVTRVLRRFKRFMRPAQVVTGLLLIIIGILLFTGTLEALAGLTFISTFQTSLDDGVIHFWHWLTSGGH
jgi:cytochrome c-type biogenesis protein